MTPSLVVPKINHVDEWHHEFRAQAIRVTDGDTVGLVVELGFYVAYEIDLRLRDIDTSELRRGTPEQRALGKAQHYYAARVLRLWQPDGLEWPLKIVTHKVEQAEHKWDRTFTRWVGDIVNRDGVALTDRILQRWPEVHAPH